MELIDVFDEFNNFTGKTMERKLIHENNLYHRHVSCWIMNELGQILLEKRASCKKNNPNMWTKIGGHVAVGETVEEGIIREIKEEIGITIPLDQVETIDIFKNNSKENCFTYNYLFYVNYKIEDYILQEDEVSEVKYFEIEKLEQCKNDPNFTFYNWSIEDFNKTIVNLKEYRNKKLFL